MNDNAERFYRNYRIHVQPLAIVLGDRYRLWFFLGVYGFLGVLHVLLNGKVAHAAVIGGAMGTLPPLLSGNPARMTLRGRVDRHIAEDYLDRLRYVREGDTWTPKTRRMFYFDSQIVRMDSDVITGPYVILRNLRERIRRSG